MTARPQREAVFHRRFVDDLRWWVETDRAVALRAFRLIDAVVREPFAGIGRPEPLKHPGADVWSRRLDQDHPMVYVVAHPRIVFLQTRYHYQR